MGDEESIQPGHVDSDGVSTPGQTPVGGEHQATVLPSERRPAHRNHSEVGDVVGEECSSLG